MSGMKDNIRLASDLGQAIRALRKTEKLKAVDIARHSGRSRDILNRLERGQDVTVSALMDILQAMGLSLSLAKTGLPTLAEMTERFSDLDEDDDAA
jgi:HTH-type transcriptional regulator/antitoxin HipB